MYFNPISPSFTLVCALKKKATSSKYLLIARPLSCNPGLPHSVWLRMLLTFGSSFLFHLLLPENRCERPRLLSFGHGRQTLCQLSYIPRPCYTPSIHTHTYVHCPLPTAASIRHGCQRVPKYRSGSHPPLRCEGSSRIFWRIEAVATGGFRQDSRSSSESARSLRAPRA